MYDLVAAVFKESRRKSIESLKLKKDALILIVGAGTGLDLEFLPTDSDVVATDITPSMVERINRRDKKSGLSVQAIVMDGQALDFADDSFDAVILHLILAVIPDPFACIQEVERVVKKGGQVVVFDKFVRRGSTASPLRRLLNLLTNFLFTDITRDFESIKNSSEFIVISDEDANFSGNFRRIKMVK